jgi:hypothetical protein
VSFIFVDNFAQILYHLKHAEWQDDTELKSDALTKCHFKIDSTDRSLASQQIRNFFNESLQYFEGNQIGNKLN